MNKKIVLLASISFLAQDLFSMKRIKEESQDQSSHSEANSEHIAKNQELKHLLKHL